MAVPASSFCVSVAMVQDNESLTVKSLMNEPSQPQEGGPGLEEVEGEGPLMAAGCCAC